jgi:arylsulfatase A
MKFYFFNPFLSSCTTLLCVFSSCTKMNEKPNILLIVADDLGYEKLGCYGNPNVLTPNLDRMAANGALFERTYASPVSTPSRMSLYTGYYAVNHKYTDVIPVHKGTKEAVDFKKWPTYAQKLRDNGYHTAVTGKWQMGALEYHPEHCREGGFDSWCVWQIWKDSAKTTRYWEATYNHDGKIREDAKHKFGSDILVEYVIAEMAKAKERNQPFCIQHNMVLPHTPIVKTPLDKQLDRDSSLDHMIFYMDILVGQLLNAIDSLGLASNTIVLFVGDNGTESKEARVTTKGTVNGGKWSLNDGGTHVPFIAQWPGKIKKGKRVASLIDITDFFATLCDLGRVKPEDYKGVDAISFTNLLFGDNDLQHRDYVTGGINHKHYIFDGQWRFLSHDSSLYDCRQLPIETIADMSTPEAQNAFKKLIKIWDSFQSD